MYCKNEKILSSQRQMLRKSTYVHARYLILIKKDLFFSYVNLRLISLQRLQTTGREKKKIIFDPILIKKITF